MTFFLITFAGSWSYLALYVYSQGQFIQAKNGSLYGEVKWNMYQTFQWAVWIFGFVWINCFLSACN